MKMLLNFSMGILVIILVTLAQFLVSLPFGMEPAEEELARFVNYEYLLTAVPSALITFTLAAIIKTKIKADALARSIIWTILFAAFSVAIGIGNATLNLILGSIGFYVTLAGIFAGPAIFANIRHLK